MKTINIDEWIESGGGARGTSYFHKDNPDFMLKFDNINSDSGSMIKELQNASVAYSLGVNTPEPGEIVTDGKRYGITFKRIHGKISYARAIADNPGRMEELSAEFAHQARILHSLKADTSRMRSIKDIYREAISANRMHEPGLTDRALKLLDSMPEKRTCVHGDLHTGNIIMAGKESFFIDMGDFSYGDPLMDISMIRATCQLASAVPDFFKSIFHFDPGIAERHWNIFVREYFGPHADIDRLNETIKPYVALRKLVMEAQAGIPITGEGLRDVYEVLGH